MTTTTSATVLMMGALDAVRSGETSSADALFREYVGAMAGTLPHRALVEVDLPSLQDSVKMSLGAEQNNGLWYSKPDAATSAKVDAFFALLQQAASRIEELERPMNTRLQVSKRINRDIATLRGLMHQITDAFHELARMGNVPHWQFDQKKVDGHLRDFRTLRRQAAEILIPLEKHQDRMNASQLEEYKVHNGHLIAMIREVRTRMGLLG